MRRSWSEWMGLGAVGGRLAASQVVLVFGVTVALLVAACADSADGDALRGVVAIDGSSTVHPLTEAVAEEFAREERHVRVPVGVSGTGGGFQRFCSGETDISNASRPIAQQELDICAAAGIEFIELPVAYDGLSVVVHPDNNWLDCLTTAELRTLWQTEAENRIVTWNQVRSAFPNTRIALYGPGTDSGTFDYFTEVINGRAGNSRADFTASEDDNILVQGVAGDRNALGYFGLAYLEENEGRIKGVPVDGGKGCVPPTRQNVQDGTYAPLSRPLFVYVRKDAAQRPEVKTFVDFYLENAAFLAEDVGYVGFPDAFYVRIVERWQAGVTGSIFHGASGSVGEILGVD